MSDARWVKRPKSGLLVPASVARPSPEEAAEIASEAASVRLHGVLAPIYIDRRNRQPELIGSGVLIRVEDLVFIATAAHVADRDVDELRLYGIRGGVRPLPAYC